MRTKIKILLLTITSVLFVSNIIRAQSTAATNVYNSLNYIGWGSTSGDLPFKVNNTTYMTLQNSTGKFGIGTTTPWGRLTVVAGTLPLYNAAAVIDGNITTNTDPYTNTLVVSDASNGNNASSIALSGNSLASLRSRFVGGSYNGALDIYTRDDVTGSAARMTVLNSGKVGISTTNPLSALHIDNATGLSLDVATQAYSAPLKYLENHILRGRLITISGNLNYESYNSSGNYLRTDLAILNSNGNVGFGTTSPLAKLHVNNGSVLFDGTIGATPTSGGGTRMMWIPAKWAFRAGAVTSTQWDNGSIGNYSAAFGYNTTANGSYSAAFGNSTTASGDYSSAFGSSTTASGLSSFSSGNSTIVTGNSASGFGYNLVAQSYSSFVIGSWNLNPGTYSTTSAVATDPVFVIGNGTSPSTRANAITVLKNGNMLINKTTQLNSLYKLDIAGTMRVNEIVVNLTGADFVFNSNYKLLPLKELELFIKENSHLPEIASAEEMETGDGVKIGEMQTKLLQKIEELTLYLIELNKTVDNLTLENKVLKTKFDIK